MRKLILGLFVVVVLAAGTAAAAAAHDGHGRWSGRHHGIHFKTVAFAKRAGRGVFEKLDGTGSSLGAATATANGTIAGRPLDSGTFSASISTDLSKSFANRHSGSCAPATGTLSLVASDTSNTLGTSLRGLACTVGSNPWHVAGVFFGRAKVANATGTLSNVTGRGRVLLVEKTDGTVKGFAFAGFKRWAGHALDGFARRDAHHCGGR